ncbi:proton-conducting transporter transmembrane domain-containing protein [Jongsikchunia kroppenstedtii]|uniref:proton-conducting transporter transmembrane domain-containing protein n=1 Tax=Jongsikchunia kroppenstedtii TaxID=1121721 RepID=UPI00037A1991|nr:proton-conducting transporter membrane subunit [Jongsikchunia kroppenstedtii]
MVLLLLVVVPLAVTLLSLLPFEGFVRWLTAASGIGCLVLSLFVIGPASSGTVTAFRYLRADALSTVFLLGATFVYAVTSVYAIGYLRAESAGHRSAESVAWFRSYSRRFYLGFNAFAWSLICAPLMNGLALLWVAIEVTTVVSALLVALDRTEEASEAAWKYVLIASSGLGIGLLATIFMYFAGSQVLGESYDLGLDSLLGVARQLPPTPVRIAFVLAVVGFGTKVGLFPVHTWLPDAHAEAPTPVSAMLSGSLLATSFYAILRYHQIALRTLGPDFPQTVLLVFGVLSLLLASLYLLQQRHLKRLLAYSSVEHMGILAIGISFGVTVAFVGVMLHVLAHAAAKASAFMGAGILVHSYGTRTIQSIRDAVGRLRWTAPLFLMAVLALSAMPPFGLFRSEFQIVAGGLSAGRASATAAVILIVLVTVAFAGLIGSTTGMLYRPQSVGRGSEPVPGGPDAEIEGPTATEPGLLMTIPMAVGIGVLLLLGIYLPMPLEHLLSAAATELKGAS